jgi:hypothetical protein
MNDEMERICKEAVMPYFKVLSKHFPTGTDENLDQGSRYPCRDMNPGPPEYEAGVLTTQPRRSVWTNVSEEDGYLPTSPHGLTNRNTNIFTTLRT